MRLCFIWHMHQPYYLDPLSGTYLLPWVRLHGCKDYLDMVTLADEYPTIKQCFNLVPSLLDQLQDYAAGTALDRHLELSRLRAEDLEEAEKIEISQQFFAAYAPTMIEPYPRYHELHQLCQELKGRDLLERLGTQDLLDLQVWFNATWIDPSLRTDKRIAGIYEKGRDFTEEEKQALLEYQIELIGRIIPAYRERQESGRIEVSFSPYYHPILPLLIDTDAARESMPQAQLPARRFQHPEDARQQIAASVELYRKLFDRELKGMWPSEGSVSQALLPLLAEQGIRWIATDEEIYQASKREKGAKTQADTKQRGYGFHQPLTVGDGDNRIGILFRDHTLSDKIGFVYSKWEPERAATDFVTQLLNLEKLFKGAGEAEPLVNIIMDGENAWEYYQNDGIDFLHALYARIEAAKGITTVLPGELFTESDKLENLPHLFAGSWIDHDFHVWIGHEEDNRAWDLLAATRERLIAYLEANPDFPAEKRAAAWKELYVAEGSDWCWWYGDDHYTDQFEIFDRLFRRHLRHIWDLIGEPPPNGLLQPLRREAGHVKEYSEPRDWMTPTIDGRVTHYFEWFSAGRLECFRQGGAMHRADRLLHQILFGYDKEKLYIRLDLENGISPQNLKEVLRIDLITAGRYQLTIDSRGERFVSLGKQQANFSGTSLQVVRDKVIEIAVSKDSLEFAPERELHFSVGVYRGEKEVEKWPSTGYISLRLPHPGETLFWEL